MSDKGLLTQKAYDYLKMKIVRCEYMPGTDISNVDITNEMGISRTPIREALQRLEQEKFVNIFPRKGVFVSSITLDLINEIFQIREIIEPPILKLVAEHISVSWLKEMKDKLSAKVDDDDAIWYFSEIDKEFHSKFVELNNNSHLTQFMTTIFDQDQRLRILMNKKLSGRVYEVNYEHIEIIDCLLEKNTEKAVKLMAEHISNARKISINATLR